MAGLRRIPNSTLIDGAKIDMIPAFTETGTTFLRDDGTRQVVSTAADMEKSVYDPTNINADAFSMDNMVETATKKILTSTERTNLGNQSGTNTGDETDSTIKTKLGITTLSGSNTGDQTSIEGITGTIAQFNTALSDADFATGGGTATGTNTGDDATNSQYSGLATSKQDTLVSGTNIKTINSTSILGSGDIVITGGSSSFLATQIFF